MTHDPAPADTHQAWMNELFGDIAVCARCAAEGDCQSGEFTYSAQYEEWTCTDMTGCDDRVYDNQEARHPSDHL